MKLWIKRTLVGIFGASVIAGGLTACGARYHGHYGGLGMTEEDAGNFRAKMVDRVARELDLNATQKQRLAVLGERLREQRIALAGNTPDPRTQLRSLIAGAQFDKATAQAVIDEKMNAIRGKSPAVVAAAADFFDGLDPAQQQRVRDFMQRRRGWFRHG